MILKKQLEHRATFFLLAFQLVREAILDGKLQDLFHQEMFRHRLATPVMLDLDMFIPPKNIVPKGFLFVELMPDEILAGKWSFAVPSRSLKAQHYIKKGLRIFAFTNDSVVVGDLWCVTQRQGGVAVAHPDLDMLGIHCKDREAYVFDVFIAPAYRGKNLAIPFQTSFHAKLKSEGYRKLYSYYYDDNLPSMRMHRMLKFEKMLKLRVSRFFFYKKIEEVDIKAIAPQR